MSATKAVSGDKLTALAERCFELGVEQTACAVSENVGWDDADQYINAADKLFRVAAALRARASREKGDG